MGPSDNGTNQQDALKRAGVIVLWLFIFVSILSLLAPPIIRWFRNRPTATATISPVPPTDLPKSTATVTPITIATAPPTFTPTINFKITPTIDPTLVAAPSSFPTPVIGAIGTNLPKFFLVGPWRDNSCNKVRERFTVKIHGVNISGIDDFEAFSVYQLVLWQYNKVFVPHLDVKADGQAEKIVVLFDKPIQVDKGRYVHVLLSFKWADGDATWEDDLYYPRGLNGSCRD
jgi:hypothetical protein